ncbi:MULTISPECIES: DUF4363 family protein [Clostridia]|uniref:DUF4363 family protein n=1 Tax=Clostridia TaxID=186801 RepID=UPI0013144E5A|nr:MULTISPECIES: DUF4363 family protein [Clostridia]
MFFNHIEQIDGSIQQGDWNSIIIQTTELKELYQRNKWKIQLLGDEGEYEGLYGSINRLIVASHEKDVINARLELATVKSFLEDIYSL